MLILCLAEDSLEHQVLFSLKNNEKIFMNIVCCSGDWHFRVNVSVVCVHSCVYCMCVYMCVCVCLCHSVFKLTEIGACVCVYAIVYSN